MPLPTFTPSDQVQTQTLPRLFAPPWVIDETPWAGLVQEMNERVGKYYEVRAAMAECPGRLREAQSADYQATLAAVAADEPTPGEDHVNALAAEFDALDRRAQAAASLAWRTHEAIVIAVQDDEEGFGAQVQADRGKPHERVNAALASIREPLEEIVTARRRLAFMRSIKRGGADAGTEQAVSIDIRGVPVFIPDLIESLGALGED